MLIISIGATAGSRSEVETSEFADALAEAVLRAANVDPDGRDPVEVALSAPEAKQLMCAASLRTLPQDATFVGGDARLRPVFELFDQLCAQGIYQRRGVSKSTQRYTKIEVLTDEIVAHEKALTDQLGMLRSLETIPIFRQEFLRLIKQPVHRLAFEPFLPDEAGFSAIREMLAAAERVASAGDTEMHSASHESRSICASVKTASDECGTSIAREITTSLAESLDGLVLQKVKVQGFADPASLDLEIVSKKYPLQHVGSEIVLRFVVNNVSHGQAFEAELELDGAESIEIELPNRRLGMFAPGSRDISFVGRVNRATDAEALLAKLAWKNSDGSVGESEMVFDLAGQDVDVDWDALEYAEPYPEGPVTDLDHFVGRAQTLKSLAKTVVGGGNARIEGQ
jgi:hypothetical protein